MKIKIKIKIIDRSYSVAMRCLEKRLQFNPLLKIEYSKCMDEYKLLGYRQLFVESETEEISKTCYLLHHAVHLKKCLTINEKIVVW